MTDTDDLVRRARAAEVTSDRRFCAHHILIRELINHIEQHREIWAIAQVQQLTAQLRERDERIAELQHDVGEHLLAANYEAARAATLERERDEARNKIHEMEITVPHSTIIGLRHELAEARRAIEVHEVIRDCCFEAIGPECQVWGDVPGWIAELKRELAEARAQALADRAFQSENARLRQELAETKGFLDSEFDAHQDCHKRIRELEAELAEARGDTTELEEDVRRMNSLLDAEREQNAEARRDAERLITINKELGQERDWWCHKANDLKRERDAAREKG